MALNPQDFATLKTALNFACTMGRISPLDCDSILGQCDPARPEPSAPQTPEWPQNEGEQGVLHCAKCGRQQGDPANATCDMQPCHFE